MVDPSEEAVNKGAKTAHSMPYAGPGIPCLALADDTVSYETYLEPH